ncbi:hypothetical protein ABFS82_07G034100 [Erythranthe guttata]
MNRAIHLLLLLLLLLHRLILTPAAADGDSDADAPVTIPSIACSDELVAFSTCLPYVAVPPNNRTDSPPPQCCDQVSSAFRDGSAICLCYFVLRPKILGFPLDSTKILSLTSVCALDDRNSEANFSMETLCSGSAVLPPLRTVPGVDSPPPPPLIGSDQESSGSSSTEEPAFDSPSRPSLSDIPTTISSATKTKILQYSTLLSFTLYTLTSVRVA